MKLDRKRKLEGLVAFVLAFAGAGCQADHTGADGGGAAPGFAGSGGAPLVDTDGDGIPDTPAGTGGSLNPSDPNAAGPMPLRRLNRREYDNTVRALLGTSLQPAQQFPSDSDGTFPFPRAALVAILDAEHLQDAAEALVKEADIAKLLPCQPTSGEAACVKTFIETFGAKAFRRPLDQPEAERLTALHEKGRGALKLDFNGAIGLVLEGMLQSPGFLYRWELGSQAAKKDGPVVKLTPYEMASRLSYFLLRSMPDQALFDAAAAGALSTDAEVKAQAERLLALPEARAAVASFFADWLRMNGEQIAARDKDLELYPEFLPDLQSAMATETERFVTSVVFEGDGTFQSLLTSPSSVVNAPLAKLYGLAAPGADFAPVRLDGTQRSGLLTRAAFLSVTAAANGSNPVKRGKRVYQGLLCKDLVPPPGVVIPPADPPTAGGTTRQRFARHEENACAGCHVLLDPLGFAFENYDGIGKYRTTDNGLPVDAASSTTLDGASVSFKNGVELSAILAQSKEAQNCFAKHWVRYALDRLETDFDQASLETANQAFSQGGFKIPALISGLTAARSFRYRALAEGEVSQ